jgi:multisubunit Na+/H+ antiporter MnhE subunit
MTNFLRLCLILLFRISCWCLISSNLETANIIFGLVVCLIIPFGDFRKLQIKALIPEVLLTLRLPIDMMKESFQLMLISQPKDLFVEEPVSARACNGSKYAEFLDLFRITFTPMSLVTRRKDIDSWRVHLVSSAAPESTSKRDDQQ